MVFWCARLEPHREAVAEHFLALNGYSLYVPKLREQRQRRGRRVVVIVPLFPCYGFVEAQAQWHRARWTVGVTAILMNGERPLKVADELVTSLRAREIRGAIELLQQPRFRSGDAVRVTAGPFVGLAGLYQNQKPRERVEILLAALGKVTLPTTDIEAIG